MKKLLNNALSGFLSARVFLVFGVSLFQAYAWGLSHQILENPEGGHNVVMDAISYDGEKAVGHYTAGVGGIRQACAWVNGRCYPIKTNVPVEAASISGDGNVVALVVRSSSGGLVLLKYSVECSGGGYIMKVANAIRLSRPNQGDLGSISRLCVSRDGSSVAIICSGGDHQKTRAIAVTCDGIFDFRWRDEESLESLIPLDDQDGFFLGILTKRFSPQVTRVLKWRPASPIESSEETLLFNHEPREDGQSNSRVYGIAVSYLKDVFWIIKGDSRAFQMLRIDTLGAISGEVELGRDSLLSAPKVFSLSPDACLITERRNSVPLGNAELFCLGGQTEVCSLDGHPFVRVRACERGENSWGFLAKSGGVSASWQYIRVLPGGHVRSCFLEEMLEQSGLPMQQLIISSRRTPLCAQNGVFYVQLVDADGRTMRVKINSAAFIPPVRRPAIVAPARRNRRQGTLPIIRGPELSINVHATGTSWCPSPTEYLEGSAEEVPIVSDERSPLAEVSPFRIIAHMLKG